MILTLMHIRTKSRLYFWGNCERKYGIKRLNTSVIAFCKRLQCRFAFTSPPKVCIKTITILYDDPPATFIFRLKCMVFPFLIKPSIWFNNLRPSILCCNVFSLDLLNDHSVELVTIVFNCCFIRLGITTRYKFK